MLPDRLIFEQERPLFGEGASVTQDFEITQAGVRKSLSFVASGSLTGIPSAAER